MNNIPLVLPNGDVTLVDPSTICTLFSLEQFKKLSKEEQAALAKATAEHFECVGQVAGFTLEGQPCMLDAYRAQDLPRIETRVKFLLSDLRPSRGNSSDNNTSVSGDNYFTLKTIDVFGEFTQEEQKKAQVAVSQHFKSVGKMEGLDAYDEKDLNPIVFRLKFLLSYIIAR